MGGRGIRVFDSVPTSKVREPPSAIRYNHHFNSFVVAMGNGIVEFDGVTGAEKHDRYEVSPTLHARL